MRKEFLEGVCGQPCQLHQGLRKLRKNGGGGGGKPLALWREVQDLHEGRVALVKSQCL